MSKTALLFAGQGSQAVGMGKDLAERYPVAKELFEQANAVLGYDLATICFNGPEDELTRTDNAQPGIFIVSWVALQLLKERLPTLTFDAAAGLSLGEITALTAAGSLSFEDGLTLVHQRGKYMRESCDATEGAMSAVLGLDEAELSAVCAEAGVQMANLNCPGQIVISGERQKIATAAGLAKAKGAKRVVSLPVAGAYHSNLMSDARDKLRATLESVALQAPSAPVVSNVTALPHGSPAEIKQLLVEQVTSPVRWEASMRYLVDQGFTRFIELGPGTALTGFIRRIDEEAQVLNVGDVVSLRATVEAMVA